MIANISNINYIRVTIELRIHFLIILDHNYHSGALVTAVYDAT